MKSTERPPTLVDFLWDHDTGMPPAPMRLAPSLFAFFLIISCTLGRQTGTGPMNREDRDGWREDVMKRRSQVCLSEPHHPRGWLAISKRRLLIGIWLQRSQSALLIHPKRNTLCCHQSQGQARDSGHMFQVYSFSTGANANAGPEGA